jgi:hypothetical protein
MLGKINFQTMQPMIFWTAGWSGVTVASFGGAIGGLRAAGIGFMAGAGIGSFWPYMKWSNSNELAWRQWHDRNGNALP